MSYKITFENKQKEFDKVLRLLNSEISDHSQDLQSPRTKLDLVDYYEFIDENIIKYAL